MANKQYGLKEVANVTFLDITTGKPALFFDTLKVSTIENTSESAEARGGQGNAKLMSWDFGRSATLTMQDALLSDASLSALSGNAVKSAGVTVNIRETLEVKTGGKVTPSKTPKGNVYFYKAGDLSGELTATAPTTGTDFTIPTGTGAGSVEVGDMVVAYYETVTSANQATVISFSANAFPATYKVVGDTIVRGTDGVDRKMQFIIPKAKLQSGFSLTMEAENVSTFDFTLDILVDTDDADRKLYDIVRYEAGI